MDAASKAQVHQEAVAWQKCNAKVVTSDVQGLIKAGSAAEMVELAVQNKTKCTANK